jgi:hypothetical protein
MRTTHAFVLASRIAARVQRERSAHRKILYRLTIRQRLKHASRRKPLPGELSITRTSEAEFVSAKALPPPPSGWLPPSYMSLDGTVTAFTNNDPLASAVVEVEVIPFGPRGGPLPESCLPMANVPDGPWVSEYEAAEHQGAQVSANGAFELRDSLGPLTPTFPAQPAASGWRINGLLQTGGTGVPGASGTFSTDDSTVTITSYPQTFQLYAAGPGLGVFNVSCGTPFGAPITLSWMNPPPHAP